MTGAAHSERDMEKLWTHGTVRHGQESKENVKALGVTEAALSGGGRVGAEVDRHGGQSRVSLSERRVADVMSPPPPRVPTHLQVRSARKIGALRSTDVLVVEVEGQLVGLLDLSTIGPEGDADSVSAHMVSLDLSVPSTVTARDARDQLAERGLTCAPVVAGMFVVGSVSLLRLEQMVGPRVARPMSRAAA